jgi:hypothetical protein
MNKEDNRYGSKVFPVDNSFLAKLSLIAPLVLVLSLVISTIFYKNHHDWDYPTSIFFATQTIVGVMYGVPSENDRVGKIFTMFAYIIGTTFVATATGAYVTVVVQAAVLRARERLHLSNPQPGSFISLSGGHHIHTTSRGAKLLDIVLYDDYKYKFYVFFTAFFWYLLGVAYGLVYEGYFLTDAMLFALGAMACAGNPPPPCFGVDESSCSVGTFRSLFLTLYLIIGTPLFTLMMGQFAGLVIDRAVHASELANMEKPLSDEEFAFASRFVFSSPTLSSNPDHDPPRAEDDLLTIPHNTSSTSLLLLETYNSYQNENSSSCYQQGGDPLPSSNSNVDFSQFMILEMIRLKRISGKEIQDLKEVFSAIDFNSTGRIEYSDVMKHRLANEKDRPMNECI